MVSISLIILAIGIGALVYTGVASNAYSEFQRTKSNLKSKTREKATKLGVDNQ